MWVFPGRKKKNLNAAKWNALSKKKNLERKKLEETRADPTKKHNQHETPPSLPPSKNIDEKKQAAAASPSLSRPPLLQQQ